MTEFILQFQLSFFSIFALTALLIAVHYKEETYSTSNRLFRAIIVNMILINVLEILSWAFDGQPGTLNYVLNYGFNFTLIVITPAVAGFWASYIDFKVYNDIKRLKKRLFYQVFLFITLVLAIINFFTPVLFSISAENVYSREPLLWLNLIFVYFLLAYTLAIVIIKRKQLTSDVLVSVTLFLLLPAGAALMQMLNLGLIIMWPALSIAVIVIYLFLETQSSSKDYLTGLYNRSRLDEYVERLIEKDEKFTVIMIDLDDYKKINDTHGHLTGDKMIIMFGNLIKTVFDDKSLVCRYGGDEFLIVTNKMNDETIKSLKHQMKLSIEQYDDELFQQTKFSFGFSQRTDRNNKDFDKLLTEADDMMYQDKALNKNYKRRKSDR